ncbi:MAG: cupredoxin domain-containing protein [Dehalococcoidia bacterium]
MNTSKQINAMIVLMAVLLVGVGIYTVWDPFRAEAETERAREKTVERAAHIYARNCRNCHGNLGEGRIGPALDPSLRKAGGQLIDFSDPSKLKENQALVRNTLICGRIGKTMPPWSLDQGGSLNDEQIRQLVVLITEPVHEGPDGNHWRSVVAPLTAHEEELAPLPAVPDVLKSASITGATTAVCGQRAEVAATPTPTPPPVSTNITIDATDNKFDKTALSVPVGREVTLVFNNKGGALHNWHVQTRDTSGKEPQTALLAAGRSETIRFTISTAGTYNFLCDVHPVDMKGVLFVVQQP